VETDVLGEPYRQMTIDLGQDDEGPVCATLVRRGTDNTSDRAVLYVHGFTDYFFHTHVADFYADLGFDFYAIELRKHGRSLRPHQTANYIDDVSTYFEELDRAMEIIRDQDGHRQVLIHAHSTGALTVPLWAHARRADRIVDGMFLNSPFFEFNVPPAMRRVLGPTFAMVAKRKPYALLPTGLNSVYGESLHIDSRGEWTYDLDWKPLGGFGVRAGWLTAIRRAHAQVRAGLDIDVPILIGSSDATYTRTVWDEIAHGADAVLDPAHMTQWGGRLGRHVTMVRFPGGKHDLTLSRSPVREQVFAELKAWINAYLPTPDRATESV
jgi:alpha-beta hydrolase superfamily lysophospholipase